MISIMNQNQTNHTYKLNDNSTLFNNLQQWKLDLSILLNTICAVAIFSGQGMIIHYIKRHAPKERPINKLVLIDQVFKISVFIIVIPLYILSSVAKIPVYEIIGEVPCELMNLMEVCTTLKNVLAGFFMCVFRITLIIKPNIAMNIRDRIMKVAEIGGTPEWIISFGKQLQICAVVLIQMFIVAELIMYIILFRELYNHNKEVRSKNSLGLSADKLRKRQKTNVITLFGQCLSFTIEIIWSIFAFFAIRMNFSTVDIRIFSTALLTISYFVASPELKRFYLKE